MSSTDYKQAGVDLEAGYDVVRRIKKHVASTTRLGVMGGIGAFGGMFDLSALKYREPILITGTDGVGTKLKIAFAMNEHHTIGIDVVAMCVNDVLAQGAEPLVFLDYIAQGKTYPAVVEAIVDGVANGCRQAGCALVGGETAEMPGMYPDGEYDIAGFTTGVVEKQSLIDGTQVKVGDALLGIASTGVHSNGFSLVRKIVEDAQLDLMADYPELEGSVSIDGNPQHPQTSHPTRLGDILLTPTRIYVRQVRHVLRECDIHGVAHITGGGFDENIPRMLSEHQAALIDTSAWQPLPIFSFLEKQGRVEHRKMFNIFNMGIGMVLALPKAQVAKAQEILKQYGDASYYIGEVVEGTGVQLR